MGRWVRVRQLQLREGKQMTKPATDDEIEQFSKYSMKREGTVIRAIIARIETLKEENAAQKREINKWYDEAWVQRAHAEQAAELLELREKAAKERIADLEDKIGRMTTIPVHPRYLEEQLTRANEINTFLYERVESLIHERDEARKALEPFAAQADRYDPLEGDDDHPLWGAHQITIGEVRRARSVLKAEDILSTPKPSGEAVEWVTDAMVDRMLDAADFCRNGANRKWMRIAIATLIRGAK